MPNNLSDLLVRLRFYTEGDGLDFEKTRRAAFVVEDGYGELPLPSGQKGDKGDTGDPGPALYPDLVMGGSDSEALKALQKRSTAWKTDPTESRFFVINRDTKTGFFYTRGGWTIIRNLFGANSEITPGEFQQPVTYKNVATEPEKPVDGVVVFAQGGKLFMKNPAGEKKQLG